MMTELQEQANACYEKGEYFRDADGTILNERGKPAKGRDIILRAVNGYPLKRYSDLTFIQSPEVV